MMKQLALLSCILSTALYTGCSRHDAQHATLSTKDPEPPVAATTAQPSCSTIPPVPDPATTALNVTDFGARPDDDQDDTQALQNALRALKPKQWLVFPKGRYQYQTSLLIDTPGVTLSGYGATLHATNPDHQALWIRTDQVHIYGFTLTAVTDIRRSAPWHSRIAAYNPERPTLDGLVIQDNHIRQRSPDEPGFDVNQINSASSAAIFIHNTKNFLVANNIVERSLADGIHITGGSQNGRILHNTVRQTGDDLIAVVSYMPTIETFAQMSWPQAQQNMAGSLVKNILIEHNDVSGNYWGRGISVVGGQGVTIRDNQVRQTVAAAIYLARETEAAWRTQGTQNVLVENNTLIDSQTSGPNFYPKDPHDARYPNLYLDTQQKIEALPTFGHGAIEIYAACNGAECIHTAYLDATRTQDILVRNNTIQNAGHTGIRIGAFSPELQVNHIQLTHNQLTHIHLEPISNWIAANHVSCQNNTVANTLYSPTSCVTEAPPPAATGATIDCNK